MSIKLVAEISANHNHDLNIAKESIKVAKEIGADAVKIQTYTPETITIDCDNDYFKLKHGTIWDGVTLFELYKQAYTPWEWHQELFDYAREIGIEFFSTPFDKTAVDFLESLNSPIYKIASFEITDIPLIKYVASKQKPVIISIGIASLPEIEAALEACIGQGNNDITLLQCTSQYPAKIEDSNLLTMLDMKERFNVKVGLSDHTTGTEVSGIAAAMGATIIERHFILDKGLGGPDASFSLEPNEFKSMVENIRFIEKVKGNVTYDITEEKKKSRVFARSLFVVQDVKKGEKISEQNIRSIRPGYGISPKYYEQVLGQDFNCDIERGTPLSWKSIGVGKER